LKAAPSLAVANGTAGYSRLRMWTRPSATSACLLPRALRRVAPLPWIKQEDDHGKAMRTESAGRGGAGGSIRG
jgi:hypothetical protein